MTGRHACIHIAERGGTDSAIDFMHLKALAYSLHATVAKIKRQTNTKTDIIMQVDRTRKTHTGRNGDYAVDKYAPCFQRMLTDNP